MSERAPSWALGYILIALCVISVVPRLVGLTKESFWIDEILSIDLSSGGVSQILKVNAGDTHPPLYYLGLAAWRGLLGDSEAAIRGLSVAASLLTVIAVFLLTRDLGGKVRIGWWAGVLLACCALDVYYAQEARMYAMLAAIGAFSAWFLWRFLRATEERGQRLSLIGWASAFFAASLAAVYTHYLGAILSVSMGLFAVVALARRRHWGRLGGFVLGSLISALLFVPWVMYVRGVRGSLYSAEHVGWIQAQRFWDLSGGLVREFIWGSTHLTGRLGIIQSVLTGLFILIVGYGLFRWVSSLWRTTRRDSEGYVPEPTALVYGGWLLVGPIILGWCVGLVYHPVIFPPRFAEAVLPYFIVLVALSLEGIGSGRWGVRCTVGLTLVCVLGAGTVVGYVVPNKAGLVDFARQWRQSGPPDRAVFWPEYNARTASYYLKSPINSAKRDEIDRSLQLIKHEMNIWLCTEERFREAQTAVDREYHAWLRDLGPTTRLGTFDYLTVERVSARPRMPEFPLLQSGGRISFGEKSSDSYLPSGWYGGEGTFRWSEGDESIVVFALPQPKMQELIVEMSCFGTQKMRVELNDRVVDTFTCRERSAHLRHFAVPAEALREQNILIFRHPDAISPQEIGESGDTRKLALGISWLEMR